VGGTPKEQANRPGVWGVGMAMRWAQRRHVHRFHVVKGRLEGRNGQVGVREGMSSRFVTNKCCIVGRRQTSGVMHSYNGRNVR